MGKKEGTPNLPEGYRLDPASDPDAPALKRPDGTVVARFSPRSMRMYEAIEQVALEDLLRTSQQPCGGRSHPGCGLPRETDR
jgi:hypothetical protein